MEALFKYYPIGEYFTPIDGKLVKVRIDSIKAHPNQGKILYLCLACDEWKTLEGDVCFYNSETDYKNNTIANKMNFMPSNVDSILNCRFLSENQYTAWGLGEKIIQQYYFSIATVIIKSEGGYDIVCQTDTGEKLPEKIYPTREDALDNSIFEVVESDGSKRKVVGWKTKIELTNEQKCVVEEIEKKIQTLKEMGAAILYDRDCDKLRVVNVSEYEYFSDFEDSGEEFDNQVYSGLGQIIGNSDVIYVDEYNCLSIKQKTK